MAKALSCLWEYLVCLCCLPHCINVYSLCIGPLWLIYLITWCCHSCCVGCWQLLFACYRCCCGCFFHCCSSHWKCCFHGVRVGAWKYLYRLSMGKGMPLGSLTKLLSSLYGDRPAISVLREGSDGTQIERSLTYKQLDARVGGLAFSHYSRFSKKQLEENSEVKVMILLENDADVLLHVLAINRAGFTAVVVEPTASFKEIGRILYTLNVSYVVTSEETLEKVVSVDMLYPGPTEVSWLLTGSGPVPERFPDVSRFEEAPSSSLESECHHDDEVGRDIEEMREGDEDEEPKVKKKREKKEKKEQKKKAKSEKKLQRQETKRERKKSKKTKSMNNVVQETFVPPESILKPAKINDPDRAAVILYACAGEDEMLGVKYTSANLLSLPGRSMFSFIMGTRFAPRCSRDKVMMGVPMYNICGLSFSFMTLCSGSRLLQQNDISNKALQASLDQQQPNILVSTPRFYNAYNDHTVGEIFKYSSVQCWVNVSGEVRPSTAKRFQGTGAMVRIFGQKFGSAAFLDFHSVYQTSGPYAVKVYPAVPLGMSLPPFQRLLPGHSARAVSTDGISKILGWGKVGRLEIRSRTVARVWIGAEKQFPEPLLSGGWAAPGEKGAVFPLGMIRFSNNEVEPDITECVRDAKARKMEESRVVYSALELPEIKVIPTGREESAHPSATEGKQEAVPPEQSAAQSQAVIAQPGPASQAETLEVPVPSHGNLKISRRIGTGRLPGHDKTLLVSFDNEVVYKPYRHYEYAYYQHLNNTKRQDIADISPKYNGVTSITSNLGHPSLYIEMENLLHGYERPCMLEIDVGKIIDPYESDKEAMLRRFHSSNLSTLHTLKFALSKYHMYNGLVGKYFSRSRTWGYSHRADNVGQGLAEFFVPDDVMTVRRRADLFALVEQLRHIKHVIQNSDMGFSYIGCTILLAMEGVKVTQHERKAPTAKLLDFSRTYRLANKSVADMDLVYGIEQLIRQLSALVLSFNDVVDVAAAPQAGDNKPLSVYDLAASAPTKTKHQSDTASQISHAFRAEETAPLPRVHEHVTPAPSEAHGDGASTIAMEPSYATQPVGKAAVPGFFSNTAVSKPNVR